MAISNAANQVITVNLVPGKIAKPVVHLSQYDNGAGRPIRFDIYDGEQAYTIPNTVSVTLEGTKPDGYGFSYTTTKSGNTVTASNYSNQMTAVVGLTHAQLVFTNTSGARVGTIPIVIDVSRAGLSSDTVISASEIAVIEEAQQSYNRMQAQLNAITQASTVDDEVIAARVNFNAQIRGSLKVRLDDFLEYSVIKTVTDLT